jgi:RNA polymerase sigma factor (sigma-70 family)
MSELLTCAKKGEPKCSKRLFSRLHRYLKSTLTQDVRILKKALMIVFENIADVSSMGQLRRLSDGVTKQIQQRIAVMPELALTLEERQQIATEVLQQMQQGSLSKPQTGYPSYDEEKNIIAQMKLGSKEAAHQLYVWFYSDLLHQLYQLGTGHERALEIVHDTFIIVFEKIEDFVIKDPPVSIFFWLRRIAVNMFNLDMRRKQIEQRKLDSIATFTLMQMETDSNSPTALLSQKEQREQVLKALDVLKSENERYAQIVQLRIVEGRSREESAELLDMKTNTLSKTTTRALEKLQSILRGL